MTDAPDVPYGDMDPPVVRLCRAINDLGGLRTMGSCGGHPGEPANLSSRPENEWFVTLQVDLGEDERPTNQGWLSLEFLAWALRGLRQSGHAVEADFHSHPPWVNDPGHMLTFEVRGWRDGQSGVEPDYIAERLEGWMDEFYKVIEPTNGDTP